MVFPIAISTAERLSSSWLDVRHIEKYVDQGKSGTRELLWSWAQKNKTIGDLLQILQEMGHHRAIHLIVNHGKHFMILMMWLSVHFIENVICRCKYCILFKTLTGHAMPLIPYLRQGFYYFFLATFSFLIA